MRLQKFLADAGIASRRQAEKLIADRKIMVNNKIVTKPGTTVDPSNDQIIYNNKVITLSSNKIYIALHKPVGYVSSSSSEQGKSVLDLVKVKERVYPVGRLDKDSSGLIILSNDGELTNKITHPKFGHDKEYFLVLDQDLKSEDIKKLEKGITMQGKKIKGIKVAMAKNKSARFILQEGVNRQIRRMLGKLGYTAIKLKRVRIGKLELQDLKPGQWKKINKSDIF